MLDAFIIERIRQRQDRQRESAQVPLRIEVPVPEHEPPRRDEKKDDERGVVIIDFNL
jgi:vacuolar-type H+-ATPase subunit F/Vma7